jgi:hypothetical protein
MNLWLLFLVAFFWGTSNPLMKKVTADVKVREMRGNSTFAHIAALFTKFVSSLVVLSNS